MSPPLPPPENFNHTQIGNKYSCPLFTKLGPCCHSLEKYLYSPGSTLNHNDGGTILKLLPGAVQQLKLLPRVNTSHFLCPRIDASSHFNGPIANK